jgi:hypothetical protein
VTWVHPSWRDLVVDALAQDADARRRFLARCGVDGAALALSTAGGAAGEREWPLLREDADWDALADGLHHLCADVEEADAVRLLAVLEAAEAHPEIGALARLVLRRLARRWRGRAVSVDAVDAWAELAAQLDDPGEPLSPVPTWLELEPDRAPESPAELERFADWLRLAEVLARHEPELLEGLGFPHRHARVLDEFSAQTPADEPPLEHDLRVQALQRVHALAPEWQRQAITTLAHLQTDLAGPAWRPRPVFTAPATRFPVARVLRDLVD